MRNTRYIPIVLAAALAFQTSDVVRVVYTQLELFPDCPIVGTQAYSASGEGAVPTHGCCPQTPPTPVANQSDEGAPQQSPTGPQDECETCSMLAMMRAYVSAQVAELPGIEFAVHGPRLHRPVLRYCVNAFGPFHGRAPPAV